MKIVCGIYSCIIQGKIQFMERNCNQIFLIFKMFIKFIGSDV